MPAKKGSKDAAGGGKKPAKPAKPAKAAPVPAPAPNPGAKPGRKPGPKRRGLGESEEE